MVRTILIQGIVVLVAARLFGYFCRRIGQPQVVGEMIAGLALGPSLLGRIAPGFFGYMFSSDALEGVHTMSRLGVWLFIFLVGVELDLAKLRRVGRAALVTSQASILVPFALGAWFAATLYPLFREPGVPFLPFALFIGAAMSITAFPVLASILKERGITNTELGVMATACAAVDDVTAWCILAVMMVIIQPAEGFAGLGARALGLLLYLGAMWLVVRPLLRRWEEKHVPQIVSSDILAACLILLFASCAATQWIGIHGLFGAFFFGVMLPKPEWLTRGISERLEPVTATLLLPFFFVYSGLRTNVTLISGSPLWAYCAGIFAIAVIGKMTGAMVPARLMGQDWRQAAAVGALMNTRGLMELVILNIGLELHVLSPTLFSMMVLMALFTTLMTGPLLNLILGSEHQMAGAAAAATLPPS